GVYFNFVIGIVSQNIDSPTNPVRFNSDVEDGLPVFLYKGLLSSDVIKEDAQRVADMARR
ncbi:hypothetical protein ABTM59_04310, partial [Acinetobacter baumannii]